METSLSCVDIYRAVPATRSSHTKHGNCAAVLRDALGDIRGRTLIKLKCI